MMKQILSVSWISLRSLPQRLWLSLATILTIAVVVAVLLAFLAMSNGFRKTLEGTGSDDVALILRGGASTELNSVLNREDQAVLETAAGIAKNNGEPMVSGELYVVVNGIKKTSGTKVNLPLRGLSEQGIAMRGPVTISQGRLFVPGRNELVVGRALLGEFDGFDLNSTVRFGATDWNIVGVFETGGTVFESELWSDLAGVQNQFNRGSSVQSVRAKLTSPDAIEDLKDFVENDPRLGVDVISEKDYFKEQSQSTSDLILVLGWPLAIAMGLGALAGALNTIYTSVAARAREIATLRAIGFSSLSAFFGTLSESLALSVLGGLLGAAVAWSFFDGLSTSTLGGGFTQVVFSFQLGGALLVQGAILALGIGLVGGFFPAIRAARLPVAMAFSDR
ncbi:membrane protein [Iodidimonas gelatinilytica]|uniref:Membrane protein n=1 Tax=Iodidimonas gelatinilytica TaxID=1236966 RepID=A0A5A7MRG9_9PROT|nr:ABC transporter permease [Iodidimonas gelatinilytica]GEQ98632.1 membrane protein [Iodidimonas gelatinilytica]GER01831.1 membrane protein [Iodidimonas gelatinilytica]